MGTLGRKGQAERMTFTASDPSAAWDLGSASMTDDPGRHAIVVGVNGSAQSRDALAAAGMLATVFGDDMRPVNVHGPSEPRPTVTLPTGSPPVETIAGRSAALGLRRAVAGDDVRALVIGSSHRGAIGRVLHGSVGQQLVSEASCPIVVAPTGYADAPEPRLRTIACGLDGSSESRAAWEATCRIAERADATVRLIAVFEPRAFTASPMSGYLGPTSDELRKSLNDELMSALASAPHRVRVEARLLDGDASNELHEASLNADLLVLGSRGFGLLGALLLRSVTGNLMSTAACPVMVIPRWQRTDAPRRHHSRQERQEPSVDHQH